MNLGCLGMTLRQSSSSLRGRLYLHCDRRKQDKFRAMSNRRWFVFLTLKASCRRNLFNQDRQWMKKSTATFWGDWGKSCSAYIQIMEQLLQGPESWRGSGSRIVHCAAFFGFYEDDSHPSPSLITKPRPAICSYSQRWNWSWRGNVLTALKRSRLNRRTWRRHWRDMTSSSASDHRFHWDHWINAGGGYFEGDGGEQRFQYVVKLK